VICANPSAIPRRASVRRSKDSASGSRTGQPNGRTAGNNRATPDDQQAERGRGESRARPVTGADYPDDPTTPSPPRYPASDYAPQSDYPQAAEYRRPRTINQPPSTRDRSTSVPIRIGGDYRTDEYHQRGDYPDQGNGEHPGQEPHGARRDQGLRAPRFRCAGQESLFNPEPVPEPMRGQVGRRCVTFRDRDRDQARTVRCAIRARMPIPRSPRARIGARADRINAHDDEPVVNVRMSFDQQMSGCVRGAERTFVVARLLMKSL